MTGTMSSNNSVIRSRVLNTYAWGIQPVKEVDSKIINSILCGNLTLPSLAGIYWEYSSGWTIIFAADMLWDNAC